MPIHPDCATEIVDLLKAEALTLLENADKAARDPRTRRHEQTLRDKAHGLGYAVAQINAAVRAERAG